MGGFLSDEQSVSNLVLIALLLRTSGAAVRTGQLPLTRWPGWALCAIAAWLAAAAAGAFSPLIAPLAAGIALAFFDFGERRAPAWVAGDLLLFGLCAWSSIPRLSLSRAVVAALAYAVVGALLDAALRRVPTAVRVGAFALPVIVWVLLGWAVPDRRASLGRDWPELRDSLSRFVAVTPMQGGEHVILETGASAWLDRPRGEPVGGVVFFHGRDAAASKQRGAIFIRRAFAAAGFVVLAVDHPGYGASPLPPPEAPVGAWDPLSSSLAAIRYLEALPEVGGRVLVAGHSMGGTEAFRALDSRPRLSAGVVLGVTVTPPPVEDAVFHRRFLRDHGMDPDALTQDQVTRIRDTYYNNDRNVASLREGHPPILFAAFTFEFSNIIETRQLLYQQIPGRKVWWEFRSGHHFSAATVAGLVVGDWRILRNFRDGLVAFAQGVSPATGRPLGYRP